MNGFEELKINKQLLQAIDDLDFNTPTQIQREAFPVIMSGKDVVGISQTGTGKTCAYLLPVLQQTKYSNQINPRILILVPTRELVMQVVKNIEELTKYINFRVLGVFGESNIRLQKEALAQGQDAIVATPGRLYDLVLNRAVSIKEIRKLIIDEVDVMLDLGFRTQINNILELLSDRRQNIMFSATMTKDVDELIDDYFHVPSKISIAISGTPLDNIEQSCYAVHNFYTKVNLLIHLLSNNKLYKKVLVFISGKKLADKLFEKVEEAFGASVCIIHSNKTQNYRIRSVEEFESGSKRILIATDVIARGLDLDKISHVINFDTPVYPENYMHRIGRTGRAEEKGETVLFYTEKEEPQKLEIEALMKRTIRIIPFPDEVEINKELIPEERSKIAESNYNRNSKLKSAPVENAEKLEKNKKVNLGGSYKRKLAIKHKKPRTRGDKNQNRKKR
ncbi:MAG: DEAD/DEAH box helicase [Reichenbachiella sp.]